MSERVSSTETKTSAEQLQEELACRSVATGRAQDCPLQLVAKVSLGSRLPLYVGVSACVHPRERDYVCGAARCGAARRCVAWRGVVWRGVARRGVREQNSLGLSASEYF